MKVNESSRSFLLLCLADGSIYSLEAWTGEYQSLTRTPPLLSSSSNNPHEAIVPSLDGRLYWRPSSSDDNNRQDHTLPLQELPLTVSGLLDHPVRSCDDSNEDCGILTAHTTTSLFALSERGDLLWKTAPDDDVDSAKEQEGRKSRTGNQQPTLLLQRKDYWIQRVQSDSGEQSWNVSLGTYSALDFELSPADRGDLAPLLLDDDGEEEDLEKQLPAIVFSNAGRTVTAIDHDTRSVLWRQDVPTTLSSVFGIAQGKWRTVRVLQPQQATANHQRPPRLFLPSPTSTDYNADFYENILLSLHHQRIEEQQMQHAKRVMKELPGGEVVEQLPSLETTPPRKMTSQQRCYVDVDGSIQCPDPQLRLPSPEPPQHQPTDGIFLSWSLVCSVMSMLVLIVGFLVIRWQRRRRRESQEIQELKERVTEMTTTPPLPEIPSPKPLDPTPETSINNSIPLVRYSRYASEFQEQQKLGKGGFGSVYECENMLDGRKYAIKKVVIEGNAVEYQHHLQRVLREVKILAVLDHPHIVRYYTAWLEEQSDDDNEVDTKRDNADETSMRFESSSASRWMESDSVSDWDVRPQNHNDMSSRRPWSSSGRNDFSISLPQRRELQEDSFMIFEDESKENVGNSTKECNDGVLQSRKCAIENRGLESDTAEDDDIARPSKTSLQDELDKKRHILYIQMQLCTQRTVTEFLSDPQIRQDATGAVDFPKALQLFHQIAEALSHIHNMGLIHRDLKPSNVFLMDETMSVKVGDFGLSRESTADDGQEVVVAKNGKAEANFHEDHTAGVGTRSYASPEQMNGSDYDASTDVFSLGIILFELLYPMYTGMERSICLSRLRDGVFPQDWDSVQGRSEMNTLISSMINEQPSDRPTAAVVAKQIASILGEYTIVSLQSYVNSVDENIVLLRVEAKEDSLRETMSWIREEVDIVEYGLRVQGDNSSVMEFALQNVPDDFVQQLRRRPEIDKVRQVSTSSQSRSSQQR